MRLINRRPSKGAALLVAALPFAVLIVIYLTFSDIRLEANPNDKLLPSMESFADAVRRMAFEPSVRTGEILLWADTAASLRRLFIGIGVSALAGFTFGVLNGLIPWFSATWSPLVRVVSMIRRWRSCRYCSSRSAWASWRKSC